ncbi:MAG: hydantoinase/oxoprolinase family protein, partial [Dehalococcoidales bacterium]|nr:hydantoinase/oxoprolinase family protein [Dehalococcoidales bacterium]
MGYRISIDVGGTFTDMTLCEDGIFVGRYKSPTTPEDLVLGVLDCLELACGQLKIGIRDLLDKSEAFIHGSTTATNAILENSGAKCGLICTKGTKYTLWKGEGRRVDVFNYKVPNPKPIIRPYLCLEVHERIDREGQILVPLDEAEVRNMVRQLRDWNVETIAVCLLWSIVNPEHENLIGNIIEEECPGIPYCLSSDIQPILREYHRQSCIVLNAMLQPIVTSYLNRLKVVLADNGFTGEVLVIVSSGGVVPITEIMRRPVFMLFSGPAMGPVAGLRYGIEENVDNLLVVDMGGTSYDISTIIDKRITVTKEARIMRYPTGVAATEILTLGAGGGSVGKVDAAKRLTVGPKSAGADPGPACYMKGGTEPTVTDACVVLGYIAPNYFLGGKFRISAELARKAINDGIAKPLKISVERAAFGIYQVCKENMVGGMIEMTVRRGIDPREFVIVTG